MKRERWLAIVGFEGLYEVSDRGRVRSLDRRSTSGQQLRGKILKPTGIAYALVHLRRDNKYWPTYVHHAVLTAFKGVRPPDKQAAHRNGLRRDNRLVNLAWKTRRENELDKIAHGTSQHGAGHHNCRLTTGDVLAIRASDETARALAERHSVTSYHIHAIRNRRRWAHV